MNRALTRMHSYRFFFDQSKAVGVMLLQVETRAVCISFWTEVFGMEVT